MKMRIALCFLIFGVAGCGTVANLDGKRYPLLSGSGHKPVRVYGGVRNDIDWISDGIGFPESKQPRQETATKRHPVSFTEDPVGIAFGIPVFGYFAVVDPVLSFLGDTVTLPIVLKAIRNPQSDRTTPTEFNTAVGNDVEER